MEKINYCRCCKEKSLLKYLNLGKQPLANSYHKKNETLPKYPLEVMVCNNCFHSQLSVVVNPEIMFKNYLYVSGTTKTFREHTKNLAENAVKRFSKKKLTVLDIACNDGTQLEYFRDLGCEVFGVDPAENLRELTKNKNIPVVVNYWSPKIAKQIKKKFDIITGTNVFAHVDNLDDFLEGVKIALKKDGMLILEFPYADKMIKHNEFDTVYHEHLSYFLVNSFTVLLTRMGFHIIDVLQTPIHGGSIRFFIKKGIGKQTSKIDQLRATEKRNKLLQLKTYFEFAKRVQNNKNAMKHLITKLKKQKKKILGYGASAKGNTMLNYFKLDLDYIVDDNKMKWGLLTPGRNISINNPQILANEQKQMAIIILSWNFFNEIVRKIISIRGERSGDTALVYIPKTEQIPLSRKSILSVSA